LLNFRARSIQQAGTIGADSSNQPYISAGLLGDGQIISIADTGVDVMSCYFYDPSGRVAPSPISNPTYNTSFRKVIAYFYNSCGDSSDISGGHGTHVAGIALGKIDRADITTSTLFANILEIPHLQTNVRRSVRRNGTKC
jgi:subtilisin family serine protease